MPHCPFVSPYPQPAGRCRWVPNRSFPLTWQTWSHPGDAMWPGLTQLAHPSCFQWLFKTSGLPLLMLLTFLKSLKGTQTPNKHQLAWLCPVPLAKRPQVWHEWQPVSSCIVTPIRWPQAWHKLQPVFSWNATSTKQPNPGISGRWPQLRSCYTPKGPKPGTSGGRPWFAA